MKMRWMTSAVLTLGVCAAAPVMAGEDRGLDRLGPDVQVGLDHLDRDWRDHREVAIAEVPARVIETAQRFGNGRHIDSIVFVRTDQRDFYVVHMSRSHKQDISLRIDSVGGLIAIDR
jgi:hypothetical protein